MRIYYFTFGFGQQHENGFTVICAPGWEEARHEMFRRFGREWSNQYTEETWTLKDGRTQQETYGLKEIK